METASFGATSFVDVVSQRHRVVLRCYGWLILYYPVWGSLLDDDKTSRRYATVGRGRQRDLAIVGTHVHRHSV